jgi:cytochrome c biogenesis protein CcmG, thiol:disulfide interchange protein DsbE
MGTQAPPRPPGPPATPSPGSGADAAGSRRVGVVVASAVVLVTLALATVLIGAQLPGGGLAPNPVGSVAPAFELVTLDGDPLALADVADGPVLLTFWASWCTTCKADMPALDRLARTWGPRGVTVVGVVIEDRFEDAVASAAEHRLSYPSVFDAELTVKDAYGVTGTPETYLIGADGRVAAKWIGPVPEHDVEFQLALATG